MTLSAAGLTSTPGERVTSNWKPVKSSSKSLGASRTLTNRGRLKLMSNAEALGMPSAALVTCPAGMRAVPLPPPRTCQSTSISTGAPCTTRARTRPSPCCSMSTPSGSNTGLRANLNTLKPPGRATPSKNPGGRERS